MTREFSRWTDQYPTLTVGISVTDTDIADLQGKSWRLRIPFAGLSFDQRPGSQALFGGPFNASLGHIDGVHVDGIQGFGTLPELDSSFDARAQVRDCVEVLLTFDADAEEFGPVPLVMCGTPPADEAADATAGSYLYNDNNKFVVTDAAGGEILCFAEEYTGTKGEKGDPGADGTNGVDGQDGADGADGQGVPTGGTAGQILAKIDATDYNTEWVDPPEGGASTSGGGGGSVDIRDVWLFA